MNLTDYLAKLIAADDTIKCTACDQTDALRIVLMDKGPAWGKIVCDHCDKRYVRWAPKPDKKRPKRDGKSVRLLNIVREAWDYEPLYCELCLRDERDLPDGVWMEAHHVIEHTDLGLDTAANLRPLCNHCHSLTHTIRRAMRGHGTQVGKATSDDLDPESEELEYASR